jgi:hypothetical protein
MDISYFDLERKAQVILGYDAVSIGKSLPFLKGPAASIFRV